MIANQSTAILLPREIVDHIFTLLDDDDTTWSTLKACSAIRHPILRAAIDRRMYTHVILDESDKIGYIPHNELYQYLSSNRHVANYIRSLHIEIVDHHVGPSLWYDQVSSVLQIIPPSLKGITLSNVVLTRSTKKPVLWSNFPEIFRKAFLDCLWSPNIIDASMQGIGGFPLSIFNPCTRLKRLSLLQVECNSSASDAQFPPQIDSFVLARSKDLATIVSWANVTGHGLRSLKFMLDNKADYRAGHGQLTRLLGSYSNTLIQLELDFHPLDHANFELHEGRLEMGPPLTLSQTRRLTELIVTVALHCSPSGLCVNSLIPAIISLVATSPSLKRLILRTTINPWRFSTMAVPDFCRPLVSLAQDHSSLEHIELRIALFLGRDGQRIFDDIIFSIMEVPELKEMCNKGFLSLGGPE